MKKNYIIAIGLLALIAAGFILFKPLQRAPANKPLRDTVYLPEQKTSVHADSTTHFGFRDMGSASLETSPITQVLYNYVSDTLAPALNIANAKINELTRINAVLEGKLKAASVEVTKANNEKENIKTRYQSKYITIETNSADSSLTYKYDATIDVLNYSKRDWLLGPEKEYVDLSSPDPNFRINGVERFKKDITKENRLTLGTEHEALVGKFKPIYKNGVRLTLFPERVLSVNVAGGTILNTGGFDLKRASDLQYIRRENSPYIKFGIEVNLKKW